MTQGTFASANISALTSPVNAPPSLTQQFCAESLNWRSIVLWTLGRYSIGGATITSTSASISPLFKSFTSCVMDAVFPLHFQFPPTTNLPVPAIVATQREDAPREARAPRTEV